MSTSEKKCPHCGEDVSSLFVGECEDCGADVPLGQGIGWSHKEWPDRSKSRGITVILLCLGCMTKRLLSGSKTPPPQDFA